MKGKDINFVEDDKILENMVSNTNIVNRSLNVSSSKIGMSKGLTRQKSVVKLARGTLSASEKSHNCANIAINTMKFLESYDNNNHVQNAGTIKNIFYTRYNHNVNVNLLNNRLFRNVGDTVYSNHYFDRNKADDAGKDLMNLCDYNKLITSEFDNFNDNGCVDLNINKNPNLNEKFNCDYTSRNKNIKLKSSLSSTSEEGINIENKKQQKRKRYSNYDILFNRLSNEDIQKHKEMVTSFFNIADLNQKNSVQSFVNNDQSDSKRYYSKRNNLLAKIVENNYFNDKINIHNKLDDRSFKSDDGQSKQDLKSNELNKYEVSMALLKLNKEQMNSKQVAKQAGSSLVNRKIETFRIPAKDNTKDNEKNVQLTQKKSEHFTRILNPYKIKRKLKTIKISDNDQNTKLKSSKTPIIRLKNNKRKDDNKPKKKEENNTDEDNKLLIKRNETKQIRDEKPVPSNIEKQMHPKTHIPALFQLDQKDKGHIPKRDGTNNRKPIFGEKINDHRKFKHFRDLIQKKLVKNIKGGDTENQLNKESFIKNSSVGNLLIEKSYYLDGESMKKKTVKKIPMKVGKNYANITMDN